MMETQIASAKITNAGSSSDVDCTNFSYLSRDDDTPEGKMLFYVLFAIFFVCQICALTVTIAMLKNPKTKSKAQLAILYLFANLTIFGKSPITNKSF